MSYEINVSLNGRHLFATHQRSITDHHALETVMRLFSAKFPSHEGFKLSATFNPQVGYGISFDETGKSFNPYYNEKIKGEN